MKSYKKKLLSGIIASLFGGTSMQAIAEDADGNKEPVIEKIEVTVQKVSQTLQKTSAAVTAVGGEELVTKGVTDLRALQMQVPAVRIMRENTATQVFIRGIGQGLSYPQLEQPNSINFNDMYVPREATGVPFYDISQVAVLPGPQGTLYGRGSLGGVVNINYNRPVFNRESKLLVEVGNYDLIHTTLVHNEAFSDTLAGRIAIDYADRDGYMESGAMSEDSLSGRVSLLWEPVDGLSILGWAQKSERDGAPGNLVGFGVNRDGSINPGEYLHNDPWNDLIPEELVPFSPNGQVQKSDMIAYDNDMAGIQVDWDINEDVALTYIGSYLDFEHVIGWWLNGLAASKNDWYKQQTHELRFNGTTNWGNWLFGIYAYDMESGGFVNSGSLIPEIGTPGSLAVSIVDLNKIQGVAAFGQVTYDIHDNTRLIAGLRSSYDSREGRGRLMAAGFAPYDSDESYNQIDFKLALEHDLSDNVMLYTGVQTASLPGTFNAFPDDPTSGNKQQVDPAKLTAYTIGEKGQFFDDKLQLNTEFFYYDYEDLFIGEFDIILLTFTNFNAKQVEVYGNQTDIIYRPTPNDQVTFNIAYTHARFEDFTLPDGSANFDGNKLQYAPDWTANLGYFHDLEMADGYMRFEALIRFEDEFYPDFRNTSGAIQESYTKSNASITYYSNEDWNLGLWVKNIEDQAVIAGSASGTNVPFNTQGGVANLEAPRTFGVRFGMNFY